MNGEDWEAVSRRLRWLRKAMGFDNQRQWVKFLDPSQTQIQHTHWNNYEKGGINIPAKKATLVASKTGATTDWILRGVKGNMPVDLLQRIEVIEAEETNEGAINGGSRSA